MSETAQTESMEAPLETCRKKGDEGTFTEDMRKYGNEGDVAEAKLGRGNVRAGVCGDGE